MPAKFNNIFIWGYFSSKVFFTSVKASVNDEAASMTRFVSDSIWGVVFGLLLLKQLDIKKQ